MKFIFEIPKLPFFTLFGFYLICHGGAFFLMDAIYWDGWAYIGASNASVLDAWKQAGSFFNLVGRLHVGILSIGPWLYNSLTFILMFMSGVFLNQILQGREEISDHSRYLIVLLFLILPLYWSRIVMVNFSYTLCYFLFFFAWAINSRFRITSATLFFMSFNTNSMLVFFIVPFLDLYSQHTRKFFSFNAATAFVRHRPELFILPFAFFAIDQTFFRPFGLYEGYNENYNFGSLVESPRLMMQSWWATGKTFSDTFYLAGILTLFFMAIILASKARIDFDFRIKTKRSSFIALSIMIFSLACFPYWILGHVGYFTDWTSRHQLLLPLGTSLFIVGVSSLFGKRIQQLTAVFISISSVLISLVVYRDLYVDWHKQQKLIELFANDKVMQGSDVLVIEDRTRALNIMAREYRFYEWNGIVARAFGNEKRFSIDGRNFNAFRHENSFQKIFMNGDKYKATSFDHTKNLSPAVVIISGSSVQKMRVSSYKIPDFRIQFK